MEESGGVLVVMPGDIIEWEVRVSSQSRLRHVWAVFDEETRGQFSRRVVLGGEVYDFEKAGDRRTNRADLTFSEEWSFGVGPGRFRLSNMNVITSTGESREVPTEGLPGFVIEIREEPEDEEPRLGDSRLRVR